MFFQSSEIKIRDKRMIRDQSRRREGRSFTIRKDLLATLDSQVCAGKRSRWIEHLLMERLTERKSQRPTQC
jgi:hypothetical protein